MAILSDFNLLAQTTLSDFRVDAKPQPLWNSRTINNLAAHASVLSSPEEVMKNYGTINQELSTNGASDKLDKLLTDQAALDQVTVHDELQRIISNPDMSIDDKEKYIDGYMQMSVDRPDSRSLSVLVAQQAGLSTIDADENDETVESVSTTIAKTLNKADQFRAWKQSQIDTVSNFKDQAWYNTALDFAEAMIPFMDQAAQAEIRNAKGDGLGGFVQSIFLTGESKEAVVQALRNMPLDERIEATKKLIEMIKEGKGSFLPRPNELRMMTQLQDMLNEGTYTQSDKTLDNLYSLLDVVTLGTGKAFKVLFGGAKEAKDIAIMTERAAKSIKETDVADEIIKVIPNTQIDHIINNSRGFDKATSEEIGKARSEIGFGLEEGLTVDEIINRSSVFDKFSSDELDEFRRVLGSPEALSRSVVDDKTLNAAKEIIADKIVNSLPQMDSVPHSLYLDLRKTIEDQINNTAIYKPKKLSKTIIGAVNTKLKAIGAEAIAEGEVKSLRKMIEFESNASRLSTRTSVDHLSLSQTFKDSNPGKARSLNNLMEADETGNVAQATYGTSRSEAIANDRLPEVGNVDGSVRNKPTMDEVGPNPDKKVVNSILEDNGRIELADAEKALMRDAVRKTWENVRGLIARPQMSTITDTPSGVGFDVVYGPKDGGFKSATTAVEQALLGLRKYGVKAEEIEILAADELGNYIPVKGLPQENGNYLIRVKYDYEFTPGDIVSYSNLPNTKLAYFDNRHSLTDGRAGSILQHIVPASAIINRVVYESASAASDAVAKIQKKLLSLGKNFADKFTKLDKREKALVDLYRIEANEKNIPFSELNLKARGFSDRAIEALKSWKSATDSMWFLENYDVNKTLRLRGWNVFVDQANDTSLIVKDLPNRGWGGGATVFDSETNSIRNLSKEEVQKLYDEGGNISQTKTPVEFEGEEFEYIMVRQNSTGSYTRAIRNDDATLPYRHGYYPVKYTDPIFITKKYRKKGGTESFRAVATAGSKAEAEQLIKRLQDADSTGEFRARPDYKRGTTDYEDADWSTIISSGRSSQRIRGRRLADATVSADLNHANIQAPEEALIGSIKSLASRTAFRDWVEITKARWLEQNKDILSKPLWPSSVKDIGKDNLGIPHTRLADAKATWRYVTAMENGYVNILDDFSKSFFNNMADLAGNKGWGWVEKAGNTLAVQSPSNFARRKAFRFLLAANPLRQLPVQAMQALPVLLATNPLAIPKISMQMVLLDYLARGGDADSFMKVLAKKATGMSLADARDLSKHWASSGFEDAVDAHTLIRDDLANLVDRTAISKIRTAAAVPLNITQRWGFNLGEKILMRSIWLSEYDLLRKAKKTIDNAALSKLNARVRNLTLNMNRAGEMPYNENALSAAMQFFQAPHKAFSQIVFGHTGLSRADRLKLGTSYVLTYGLGAGWMTNFIVDKLKLNEQQRDIVDGGIFNLALNNVASTLFGEEVRTDFSDSLRLLQVPPVFEFWNGMMNAQVGELISSSPSASLILGNDPRITNFVKQMMRPFTVDDSKRPEEFMLVGQSFLKIFSGASNYFKARYAWEHNKSMSSKGRVIDYHVNDTEAFFKLAGFNTIDEIQQYALDDATYKTSNKYKEDIKLVIDEISARLAAKGVSNDEANWYIDMMSEAQRIYQNDPFYMEEFSNQITYKAKTGEYTIFKRLLDMANYTSPEDFEKMIQTSNLPDNAKQSLRDTKNLLEGTN